jgi:hypothetical protein
MKVLSRLASWAMLGLIWAYALTLRPLLGGQCRFLPSCSEYARQAVVAHGPWRGGWLAVRRLARCQPWGGCGIDPVPDRAGSDGRATPGATK